MWRLAMLMGLPALAQALTQPNVKMIVPYPAGGTPTFSAVCADGLKTGLAPPSSSKQAGAGPTLARTRWQWRSGAIRCCGNLHHARINKTLYKKLPYDR